MIKTVRTGSVRSQGHLEINHINVCGPFRNPALSGQQYSLVDYFSR